MTDDAVPEDTVVATALRLLPVPDHGDEFWSQLEASVAAEPAPEVFEPALAVGPRRRPLVADPAPVAARAATPTRVTPATPGSDPALPLIPAVLRNRANLLLAAVGVAAAVVVVVAMAMLLGQRSGSLATDDLRVDEITTTTTVAPDPAEVPGAAATQVVLDFVNAMAGGDAAAAWRGLAPESQAHFGSSSAFAQQVGDTTAYETWATSKAADAQVLAVPSDAGDVLVVTLVGAADQDGVTRRWAVAFPVRIVDGTPRVEAYAFAGEVSVVVPPPPTPGGEMPTVARDDTLIVTVPRGVTAPTIALDGGDPLVCGQADGTELSEPESSPGQQCSYRPERDLEEGRHVLTVAFLAPDGAGVGARSVLFAAV